MSETTDLELVEKTPGFVRDASRVLRRLSEPGAVLALADDMDTAVVVREGDEGSSTRTAVVQQAVAQAMAQEGWIVTNGKGRIRRYGITSTGRDALRELLDGVQPEVQTATEGFAEAPLRYEPAPKVWGERRFRDEEGGTRKVRYGVAESPLLVLARRRDKDGQPFLSEDLVRCGERLREDFELSQLQNNDPETIDQIVLSGNADEELSRRGFGPDAARTRVVSALKDLGPGLSDVALRCCCFLEGLEAAEQRMGWSARSGKIVLRIALQRLKRHYAATATPESELIG